MGGASAPLRPLGPVPDHGPAPAASAERLVESAWAAHRGELTGFLVRLTRDPEVAGDIVQEAYLRLWRESRAGRAPDDARAWLFRVAINLAISGGRRSTTARRGLPRLVEDGRAPDSPERAAILEERHVQVEGALAELSADARTGLVLAACGFTSREIGREIGRTELATRTMLCRARARLRGRLDPADCRPAAG
jgi:RNA polymerase sigma-70 factor (ECF subfamily)